MLMACFMYERSARVSHDVEHFLLRRLELLLQSRHLSHNFSLVLCMRLDLLQDGRIGPPFRRRAIARRPVVYIPVRLIEQLVIFR